MGTVLRRVPLAVVGPLLLLVALTPVVFAASPGASAGVTKGVKPDVVVSPEQRSYVKHFDTLLFNDFSPLAHDEVEDVNPPSPDQCRNVPALDVLCDVYRIRVVKDPTPGASNFVQILVSWDKQASTPALPLLAVGLGDADLPDIDLFLYADADAPIDYALVGGRSAITPERIVFEAAQEDYDLVIRSGTGVATEYTLKVQVTNELPFTPREYLDEPASAAKAAAPAPTGSVAVPELAAPPGVAPLALAPVDTDEALAGIGLGATEQFDPELLGVVGSARDAVATAAPPSTIALLAAMVLFPLLVAAATVAFLRRRRRIFVA